MYRIKLDYTSNRHRCGQASEYVSRLSLYMPCASPEFAREFSMAEAKELIANTGGEQLDDDNVYALPNGTRAIIQSV